MEGAINYKAMDSRAELVYQLRELTDKLSDFEYNLTEEDFNRVSKAMLEDYQNHNPVPVRERRPGVIIVGTGCGPNPHSIPGWASDVVYSGVIPADEVFVIDKDTVSRAAESLREFIYNFPSTAPGGGVLIFDTGKTCASELPHLEFKEPLLQPSLIEIKSKSEKPKYKDAKGHGRNYKFHR